MDDEAEGLAGEVSTPGLQGLTVEEALELAFKHSESIRISRIERERQQAAFKEAGSNFFPVLDLQLSSSLMTNTEQATMTLAAGSLAQVPLMIPQEDTEFSIAAERPTFFKINFSLTQPVFTWFKLINTRKIAGLDLEIARWRLLQTEREVRKLVRQAYFGTTLSRDTVRILSEIKTIQAEVVGDTENSFNEGLVNRHKVLEMKSRLAEIEKRLVEAEENYLNGLSSLAFFTGREADALKSPELISLYRQSLPELREEIIVEEALAVSPEKEIVQKKVSQATASLAIEKSGSPFKPDIALTLNYEISGAHIPFSEANWIDSWKQNLIVTIGTKMKLFDSLQSQWKKAQAREAVSKASLGLAQVEKSLRLNIRKAVANIHINFQTLKEKAARLNEAQEFYKNAKTAYRNELLTRAEECQAHILCLMAELESQTALFQFEIALTELEYLTGRTWQEF